MQINYIYKNVFNNIIKSTFMTSQTISIHEWVVCRYVCVCMGECFMRWWWPHFSFGDPFNLCVSLCEVASTSVTNIYKWLSVRLVMKRIFMLDRHYAKCSIFPHIPISFEYYTNVTCYEHCQNTSFSTLEKNARTMSMNIVWFHGWNISQPVYIQYKRLFECS